MFDNYEDTARLLRIIWLLIKLAKEILEFLN